MRCNPPKVASLKNYADILPLLVASSVPMSSGTDSSLATRCDPRCNPRSGEVPIALLPWACCSLVLLPKSVHQRCSHEELVLAGAIQRAFNLCRRFLGFLCSRDLRSTTRAAYITSSSTTTSWPYKNRVEACSPKYPVGLVQTQA